MATITESRFSNPAACRIHLHGYEQVLRNRGDLENSLLRSSSKATQLAHLMPYLVCEPVEEEGSNDLKQIEDFLWFLNAELPPPVFTQLSCPNSSERKDNENLPGVTTICSHEELASYVQPDESRTSIYTDESSIFLSLYLITAGLRYLGRFSLSADRFISHLESALRAASAVDKNTGALLLTDQGFMWVVFNVVQEDIMGAAWGYTDALVFLLITSTAALKAFRKMTSKSARCEMRHLLYRDLLGLPRRD